MPDQSQHKPAIEQFQDAIAAMGITPPDSINADGKIHRFSSNGNPGNDAGWYAFHDGEIPTGSFGDFRTGEKVNSWVADIGRPLTPTEFTDFKKKQADIKKKRDTDIVVRRAEAKKKAAAILQNSQPAADDHPYLVKKGVKAHGLRQWKDLLTVPMFDESGEVQSLQLIAGDGGKKFLKGGKMQGCFYAIGDTKDSERILIAEGYATAATIHETTGLPVIVAYNAGNLVAVAKAIRAQHPNAEITICADDDYRTEGNPGITKANAAAEAINASLIVPEFGEDRPDKATDFNDMAAHQGKDSVTSFFIRRFFEQQTDPSQPVSDGDDSPQEDNILAEPTPHPKPSAVNFQLKRHFSADELDQVNRIWKKVPHQLTSHSEASYQIVMDGKDKITVTKGRINLSCKSKRGSDAAYNAACEHALQFWQGRMEVHGSQRHKIKAWAFASLHGVEVANFSPSESEMIEAKNIMREAVPLVKLAERPVAGKRQNAAKLDA